ncbi:MAG: hypothetical protein ACFBSD_07790 [Paracoccaceae bacterium]
MTMTTPLRSLAAFGLAALIMGAGTGSASALSCPSVGLPGISGSVGTYLAIDRVGNTDKCVVHNTNIRVNPTCGSSDRQVRAGRDRCVAKTRSVKCPAVRNVPGVSGSVGTVLRIDAKGNADRCVVANTFIKVAPICAPGWKKSVRHGRDICRTR